jgi:hypothetical protein
VALSWAEEAGKLMKTEPVAGGVPCAPSLAEIIARAAEDAHARLKAQEAAAAATQIERARTEVAEALVLWGDTPCPAAAHTELRAVAFATDMSTVTSAAERALKILGHPEIIRVYLRGGAQRYRLGADGVECAGPHGPGPSVAEHPATREETRRRMEPWLALPPERQFEELLQGGIYQRTMVSDGAGGHVSRYEAQCLGVLEEWERRYAVADRRNEERYQARCKQDKEAQEQEVEREQREQEEARARSERKPAMIERIIQRYGDALTKQGRAEGKILNSEACAKAGMARLATPDRPVESMGIEPLPGAEALLAFEGAAAEHEAREAIEERRRRAADEIVGGLPPCHRCRVTATWGCLDLTGHPFKACDLHKETGGIDGDQPPRLLPYASAVREYLGAVSEQTEATDRERGRTHAAVLTSAKLLGTLGAQARAGDWTAEDARDAEGEWDHVGVLAGDEVVAACTSRKDADFIAAAHNLLPALIAELDGSIVLTEYQRSNLLAVLQAIGYPAHQDRSPLDVCNTGDWVGEVALKLRYEQPSPHAPNVGPTELAERARRWRPEGRSAASLALEDKGAQDVLWSYALRLWGEDKAFSEKLQAELRRAGYTPPLVRLSTVPSPKSRPPTGGDWAAHRGVVWTFVGSLGDVNVYRGLQDGVVTMQVTNAWGTYSAPVDAFRQTVLTKWSPRYEGVIDASPRVTWDDLLVALGDSVP